MNTSISLGGKQPSIPPSVWLLTLVMFIMGTAEFVISGILLPISTDLSISLGTAGLMLTSFALGMVFLGPILIFFSPKIDKKTMLLWLLVIFILSNVILTIFKFYPVLLLARFFSGGVFSAAAALSTLMASNLVNDTLKAKAMSRAFMGIPLGFVLGIPFASWLGSTHGWQWTFAFIAGVSFLSFVLLFFFLPSTKGATEQQQASHKWVDQFESFTYRQTWVALLTTVLAWTAFLTVAGYIAPLAESVAGYNPAGLAILLIVVGIGYVLGNNTGGLTYSKAPYTAVLGWQVAMLLSLLLMAFFSSHTWLFTIFTFLFGIASWGNVPTLHMNVLRNAKSYPELVSVSNIAAFNVANALGSVIGGFIVDRHSLGSAMLPYVAAIISLIGIIFFVIFTKKNEFTNPLNSNTEPTNLH